MLSPSLDAGALFIRRVARFVDFERANYPPRQLRVNTSKLFFFAALAFTLAVPATRSSSGSARARGGDLEEGWELEAEEPGGRRVWRGMQRASSSMYCGALIAPAPHGAGGAAAALPRPGRGPAAVMWTSAEGG
jgi:hypothetical protein